MFNPAVLTSPFEESLAPVARFCVANNCGRVIFPGPFQHESGLCDICIARIRPCKPFAVANNSIGDTSQILFFTPSGEFLREFSNRFTVQELAGGSNHHVPPAPSIMRSRQRHPQIPSPVYFQHSQPIPHVQTPDSDWVRSTYVTYRPEVFAGTIQRVSSRNVLSNTNTSLPHEITSQDRQPTLQHPSLNCERCGFLMSNHLIGNNKFCSSCLFAPRLAVSPKPSLPFSNPDSFKCKDVIDLTGNNERPALIADTASAAKTMSGPSIRIKIRPPSAQSSLDRSRPSKRQRIDEDGRNASTDNVGRLSAVTAEGNFSKICSTPSCNQTALIGSCSSRCISCVKLDWKSIKDRFKTSRLQHERRAENTLPSALAKSTKAKPRKSVTWSDTVTVASGDGIIIQCLTRNVEEDHQSVSDDIKQAEEGVDRIADGVYTSSNMVVVSSSDTSLELEPRTMETEGVRLAPLDQSISYITGWDSELSELTESDESDSDDSPQISAPTGLKIRIPARSSIVYSRKCRNPCCSQVLAFHYLGKTCLMCRVHHRKIQQRRKGLQDEDDVTMLDENPPKLIPNARLCSASDCTHFIPPHEEYKFKRCSLCRLYQEERRLLRKRGSIHQSDSIKPLVDVKEIYNSFKFLPVRLLIPGRCRSLDCGFLHDDGSTSCPQCVSRRTKLMKKAGIQKEHQEVTAKQDKLLPDPNIYPQYRCYTFLLSDLEGRLKDFLKSQTLFFWFRVHHSSPIDTKALFSFDGEYSVVALDLDVVGRKTIIDGRAVKTKKDLEGIEGLKFRPKRLISVLEGGGVAIRFSCTYQASILQPVMDENVMTASGTMKPMTGELEIAVFPDHSHRCLPGEKTIIRFRLLG